MGLDIGDLVVNFGYLLKWEERVNYGKGNFFGKGGGLHGAVEFEGHWICSTSRK
jgi:hypothetical protein